MITDDKNSLIHFKQTENDSFDATFDKNQCDCKFITGLKINNSLTNNKDPFIPQFANKVCWYTCGPTVYDHSHIGHARNYVTFDVIRRILEDYFGYNVEICMNITDIDDKIIQRANELNIKFDKLARFWENNFFSCLNQLNCKLPDHITRVSEFVPEILAYIKQIIDNGYAYVSNGSVYFDTEAFVTKGKFDYPRMTQSISSDQNLENELVGSADKKNLKDFTLWKKAKLDEPYWDSPWGPGRPGWHIECSTMANSILGFPIDIHSGGIDLKFPHHDNEYAQAEAHSNKKNWIKYFLHSGHLHIEGLKMSKSLKNFITIDSILQKYQFEVIRLLFLLHRWDQPMNFKSNFESLKEPLELHRTFKTFFSTMECRLRSLIENDVSWKNPADVNMDNLDGMNNTQYFDKTDLDFSKEIEDTKTKIHAHICDNFNTPNVIIALQKLISKTNTYVSDQLQIKGLLILRATRYIHKILNIFGLIRNDLFYGLANSATSDKGGKNDRLIDVIAEFRRDIRTLALGSIKEKTDPQESMKKILDCCSKLRDQDMKNFDVLLEDSNKNNFLWRKI